MEVPAPRAHPTLTPAAAAAGKAGPVGGLLAGPVPSGALAGAREDMPQAVEVAAAVRRHRVAAVEEAVVVHMALVLQVPEIQEVLRHLPHSMP